MNKPRKRILLGGLGLLGLLACDTTENPAAELLGHVRALTLIIEDNAGDCAGTLQEFQAYVQKHKAAMEASLARGEQMDKKAWAEFDGIMARESPTVFKNYNRSRRAFENSCRKKVPYFPYADMVTE